MTHKLSLPPMRNTAMPLPTSEEQRRGPKLSALADKGWNYGLRGAPLTIYKMYRQMGMPPRRLAKVMARLIANGKAFNA